MANVTCVQCGLRFEVRTTASYCSDRCNFFYRIKHADSGCWEWQGTLVYGYGQLRVNGKQLRAHKYSWELYKGPMPEGAILLHKCDNPKCVNPDHLRLGTHRDNALDRSAKGRHGGRGGRNPFVQEKVIHEKSKHHRHCIYCGVMFEGVTTAKVCSLECAFWSKVKQTDGCWEWQGVRNDHGYGQFNFRYVRDKAHRVSWKINHGEDPKGLDVLHSCDNPACVNPDHLFLGTAQDNVDDMRRKKRHPRGERCWKAALTEDDVRAIRASSERNCDLATRYGVGRSAITLVRKRLTWQHVD